jgi:arylsulfatase A-like enzyme
MKKNLIIIMIDGGRWDNAKSSDFFKKLNNNSVSFSQSITYGPHTIAAMHAVFSGSYGNRTGTNSYWSTFKFKKNSFKTLTEYVHELNYFTYADVINRLVIPQQGFDEFVVHDEKTDNLTLRHIDLLNTMKKKHDNGKNFFLYLHYSNIHTTIMEQVLKVYDNFSKEYFENKTKNKKRYDELFSNAEKYLINQLDVITSLGLDKNSLILIMSDHGVSIGEKIGERAYGAFCYDYTLRTITHFMADDLKNQEISNQIRTVDFMPTILDYLEIPLEQKYEKLDGISLIPLINGKNLPEHFAFSETGNPLDKKEPPKEPNTHSIRSSNWKLIYNDYDNTKELYDLEHDPQEQKNLINTGKKIELTLWEEMKQILKKYD